MGRAASQLSRNTGASDIGLAGTEDAKSHRLATTPQTIIAARAAVRVAMASMSDRICARLDIIEETWRSVLTALTFF
jgi:hypothetical protein